MNSDLYDLLVIGGGSGGVRAARMAAQKGARVALIEGGAMGGTCVNVGCIPKKIYSYAAQYSEIFEQARGFGWTNLERPSFDWELLKANRRAEISRLNAVYLKLLENSGVHIVGGWAKLIDGNTVSANGILYRAQQILIATGGRPMVPNIVGREYVLTSNEIFDLPVFPKRLVVVGGGYIASEFASIFNGLGAQVTQLYRGDSILRGLITIFAGSLQKSYVEKVSIYVQIQRSAKYRNLILTLK